MLCHAKGLAVLIDPSEDFQTLDVALVLVEQLFSD